MASIERTAYPRLNTKLTEKELAELYQPSESEFAFVRYHAKGASQRLTLLLLLKCHQHLGYLPAVKDIPQQLVGYLLNVSSI